MEDDVGITGSALDLLQVYKSCAADLLLARPPFMPDPSWNWRGMHTREFAQAAGSQRLQVLEMAMRVSSKFLRVLDTWSKAGRCAWSEMAWPTVASMETNISVEIVQPRHIGFPFSFDGRVDRQSFACLSKEIAKTPQLLHALKFGIPTRWLQEVKEGCGAGGYDMR
eukprot:6413993-Amphidinium_carterae.1